jgi:hypothetical protein
VNWPTNPSTGWDRKAGGHTSFGESLMKVSAAQIKPQLGMEPSEESLYVVGGFSGGIGDGARSSVLRRR